MLPPDNTDGHDLPGPPQVAASLKAMAQAGVIDDMDARDPARSDNCNCGCTIS